MHLFEQDQLLPLIIPNKGGNVVQSCGEFYIFKIMLILIFQTIK